MTPILLSISTFFSTVLGGLFGIKHRDRLHYIISFTAGVLVSVVFFDILPEIFQISSANQFDITHPLIALVAGFLAIHILEKYIRLHHIPQAEVTENKHPTIGLVGALGLAFHSFLDGIGIGLGFHVSPHVGLLIAVAIIIDDFSDGLNTVSLMLVNKNSTRKAIKLLLLDAITPFLGVLATFVFSIPEKMLVLYLGFFAGFLLYIATVNLLPAAHAKHSSFKLVGLTILGVLFMFIVTRLT